MDIQRLLTDILQFRQERDWERFHTPKNLAVSISIEAGELLELFQWNESAKYKERVRQEIADVFIYLILLCEELSIDLDQAVRSKMRLNRLKYPVDKVKGTSRKHDEY